MTANAFTRSLLLLVAAIAGTGAAGQSTYPDKPVRLVIGFPGGSVTDLASRILAHKMSEILGQPVVVDNRPGASTSIAAVIVAKSAPDGYTLFMAGNSNAVTPSLQKSVPFDFFRDFSPVALAVSVPNILVVDPALGVSDVPQLAEMVKKNPGKVFFASSGNGTMSHLAGELFGYTIGSRMTHVPYKGSSQALTDLLAGTVPVMFAPASTVLPYLKSGKLVLHVLRIKGAVDRAGKLADDAFRRIGRRDDTEPDARIVVGHALFGDRRQIGDDARALGSRRGKRLQLAAL